MDKQLERIEGTVEEIVFHNDDTGFTVLELDDDSQLITVVGSLGGVEAGERLVVMGRFTTHPAYGSQFQADACERSLPATSSAILKYLSSGAIKGIGPGLARRIVDMFGEESLTVIEQTPRELSRVKGISVQKADSISEEYRHIFGIRSVMVAMSALGIDTSTAIRAWKRWGMPAAALVRENPYALCCQEVGLSFEQADAVGKRLGLAQDNTGRIVAGLLHVLRHNLSNGHTCLPEDKLTATAAMLLELEIEPVENALAEEVDDNGLIRDTVDGTPYIYLPQLYDAETYIAGRLSMMLAISPPKAQDCGQQIKLLEKDMGISYAEMQRRAINTALSGNLFILTGGPGTGKTTTLNAILSLLEAKGDKVALAAPTGRAAKRMSEVTGRDASTIHRLLEVDFADPFGGHKFKRNEKNPLRFDTVILDEMSMVDTMLLSCLLRALRIGARLILVGDPDQLPSVGAGNVLRDLIASDCIPTVHLDEIFRQSQDSLIVRNAHRIIKGEPPDLTVRDSDFFFMTQSSYEQTAQVLVQLLAERLPAAYGYDPFWDIQVITPSRIGGLGTTELNRLLQDRLNPADAVKAEYRFGNVTYREHDKVMQIRNNYDIEWKRESGETGTGVFNGDIGIIKMIDRPSRAILIQYEDRVAEYTFDMVQEIEHSYAITIHKSQGSEFEAVIMPLMRFHPKLYYRNLLYTGVTRARKLLILMGEANTICQMAENDRKVLRYTNLAALLVQGVINGVDNDKSNAENG